MKSFTSRCARCGAMITLVPPWMHPKYSCDCGPSGLLSSFSKRMQAIPKGHTDPMTYVPHDDELTPDKVARMYYYIRELSIKHAGSCKLCNIVAIQGLACPDLYVLRALRNKWLALKAKYPEEKRHGRS